MNRQFAQYFILIAILLFTISFAFGTMVMNENIQNWSAHTAYGSYTQIIPVGTVNLANCLVSPGSASNVECSAGRIQMAASSGVIEFPELISSGDIEFTFAAGSSGRSVKLQAFTNNAWVNLTTFNGITGTGSRFYYRIAQNSPTLLRLALPSHALYVHDIFMTDFNALDTPSLATPTLLSTTYNTITLSTLIGSAGSTPITARGFCWSIGQLPTVNDGVMAIGSGISPLNGTITNLAPNTLYNIRAFAINTSGTAYSEQIQATTLDINVPSIQASNLVFYPGNTAAQVSWSPGDGARRIVKINTENSFTDPTNGIEYTPNTVYNGTGEQVVYCDATQIIEGSQVNEVTVTGLIRNTMYWFRIYEMNGASDASLYLTIPTISNPSFCTTLNTGLTGYYDGISGTGVELKEQLHNLIRTTHLTQYSYDSLWQQLQYTDEDSLNTYNVIETYTGWSVPKSYYGTGSSQWNREHTWSVSHGGFETNRPAGTDLHHIRPCDVTVNSAKGNKDFNDGGNPYIDSSPYPGYSSTTGSGTSTNFWEPRPSEKGDVARMLFYMAVRYEGTDTGYNLEMIDAIPSTGSYYGSLSTLIQWSLNDPPDSWERRRNDRIQERQGNRNPFIDHPEYVTKLWIPTASEAFGITDSTFAVQWTQCVNAVSYQVDVSTDSLFTNFVDQNHDMGSLTMSSFYIGNLDTVYFRVRAFFGIGYSPYSNAVRVDMNTPLIDLESFTATFIDPQHIQLYWTTNNEAHLTGYNIFRSQTSILEDADIISGLIAATNTNQSQTYIFTDADLPSQPLGGYLYYWLNVMMMDGNNLTFAPDSVYIEPTGNNDENQVPASCFIAAYPNPFSNSIKMKLYTDKTANVGIYNIKGQLVKHWQQLIPGKQILTWDGKDDTNKPVAAGIYLLRLNSGQHSQTIKLLKMK